MKSFKSTFLACFKALSKANLLVLFQFFFIIFVYHTLKDLKDSLVITASDAGAEVIPFIKIWGMLPFAFVASYGFSVAFNRFGREKAGYIIMSLLLGFYFFFAFILYPCRDFFHLETLELSLKTYLPSGCKGFISMICYWHYTLFYLTAELWSLLILSILFWGYVNETTSFKDAKEFYPLCMFVGNFAGIFSGQISHYLCHHLAAVITWEKTLQLMIMIIISCGFIIMFMSYRLEKRGGGGVSKQEYPPKSKPSLSFKDNLFCIFQSGPLTCIAILVIGFGLTSNLIEVVWKENIKRLYPTPQDYNAYVNQLTTLIGIFAVIMALASRWIFKRLNWSSIALISPVTLFVTCSIFFSALLLPQELLSPLTDFLHITPLTLVVTLGSVHYVLALTAKYTLFDTTKEMAFLSINAEDRMRAKSVIDSVGSRLGKSGSSCLYQFLLIAFGSTSGHTYVIGIASIAMIAASIVTTRKLGISMNQTEESGSTSKGLKIEPAQA